MRKNVVIVGGGLSGLAAAIYLARAGRTVTVFEKRRFLGGRSMTHLRRGFRFNVGPHTFHRGGEAAAVCRELGIPIRGGAKKPQGIAVHGGGAYRLPSGWLSLLTTGLLSIRGKRELAAALRRIRKLDSGAVTGSLADWLDGAFDDERARATLRALVRATTLCDDAANESASTSLGQLKNAMRGSVYIDEGWQKIVDSMQSAAISSGVNFVTSSRVVSVETGGERVRSVVLGGLDLDADRMDTPSLASPQDHREWSGGARLPVDDVVLAVDPRSAASLAGDAGAAWTSARPVTAACLDVALRSLPDPRRALVVGIDEPLYLSAHSAFAQLTPKGGALIHAMRHHRGRTPTDQEIEGGLATRRDALAAADEAYLEAALDAHQPGWRDLVVHRRFLPAMTVTNALSSPDVARPSPRTAVGGLFIAGDWVGDEGVLADAALASARAAAKAVLASS